MSLLFTHGRGQKWTQHFYMAFVFCNTYQYRASRRVHVRDWRALGGCLFVGKLSYDNTHIDEKAKMAITGKQGEGWCGAWEGRERDFSFLFVFRWKISKVSNLRSTHPRSFFNRLITPTFFFIIKSIEGRSRNIFYQRRKSSSWQRLGLRRALRQEAPHET